MSDEPTQIDWILHDTRHHTPTENWNKRNSLEHYFSAHSDERLIYYAPILRAEVLRLREGIKSLAENIHDDMRGKYMIDALMELIDDVDISN